MKSKKVLRIHIYCKKCGQKGSIDFGVGYTLGILLRLLFGQVLTAEKRI